MSVNAIVAIILVNYKGWEDTIECLESLLKLDYSDFYIIVVDNNSPNNSVEEIIAWSSGAKNVHVKNPEMEGLVNPSSIKPISISVVCFHQGKFIEKSNGSGRIILISSSENRGFSAGNNIGIKYQIKKLSAEYVWLLNNDTVVEPNTLNALVVKAKTNKENHRKIGIIGAKLIYYYNPCKIQAVGGYYSKYLFKSTHVGCGEYDSGQYDNEYTLEKINYPVGASMFVSSEFIQEVGLMNENYFLYFEEIDWAIRGKIKGWKIDYCADARVFHKEGGSIGSNNNLNKRSMLAQTSAVRSRLIFVRTHFSRMYWISVIFIVIYILKTFFFGCRKNASAMCRVLVDELFHKNS